jgi:hypothetical protein
LRRDCEDERKREEGCCSSGKRGSEALVEKCHYEGVPWLARTAYLERRGDGEDRHTKHKDNKDENYRAKKVVEHMDSLIDIMHAFADRLPSLSNLGDLYLRG